MSAVEYMLGEPVPAVVYVSLFTVTVPPSLYDLIAADNVPLVFIVKLFAVVLPPPVVIIPPALSPVVIFELLIVTFVPSLLELLVVALPP